MGESHADPGWWDRPRPPRWLPRALIELGLAVARAAFEATHGPLLPLCVESVAQPLLRASLDGYGDCPVEIKAPCRSVFERIKADPEGQPSFQVYRAQVQAQCLATGNRDRKSVV